MANLLNRSIKMQKYWFIVLLIVSGMSLTAGLYMNRRGVDVEPDSAVCMTAGILFAHGEGISQPNGIGPAKAMTWFPPTIPFLVAVCERFNWDILKSFAILNALTWGILTFLVGWLACRTAGHTPLLGILAAALILTSDAICYVHGMLYSEPLFLLWTTGSLALLAFYWKQPRLRWVAAAALCVDAALLTRYVGLTLVITGGLIMLLPSNQTWRRRLTSAIIFSTLSLGPLFAWHIWQKNVRHASSERTLEWHPISLAQINEGFSTLASFIVPPEFANFPYSTNVTLSLTFIFIFAAMWRWLCRDHKKAVLNQLKETPPLVWMSTLFILIYGSFLILSISIADADTPLDSRILSILLPPLAIIASYLAFAAGWKRTSPFLKTIALVFVGGLLALHALSTIRTQVTRSYLTWSPQDSSPLLDAIRALPNLSLIYSNEPAAVYMATRRKSEGLPLLPPENESDPIKLNELNEEIENVKQTMAPQGGWIIYWNQLHGDPVVSQEILEKNLPVLKKISFDNGLLLHIAPRPGL